MSYNLYYNTVSPVLRSALDALMKEILFAPFRLVGGTSLSLQIGHRMSEDIDLFTDAQYGSLNFDEIDQYFLSKFAYVHIDDISPIAFGKMYRVGDDKISSVKIDVMYSSEPFIRPALEIDGIRMASVEEIIAMKLDILPRGGRKKDFWDLHAFIETFTLEEMITLYIERYPYSEHSEKIRKGFTDFKRADGDLNPNCLWGKYWELIQLDLIDFAAKGK